MCILYYIIIIYRKYIYNLLIILQYTSATFLDFIPNMKKENKINEPEKKTNESNYNNKN